MCMLSPHDRPGTWREIASAPSTGAKTGTGAILVGGPVTPGFIVAATLDPGLRSFRPASRQREALSAIAALPGNGEPGSGGQVFVAHRDNVIGGYLTFNPPEPFESWARLGPEGLVMLSAIEIAPGWRGLGVGQALLDTAFGQGAYDQVVVIATLYAWHWDLPGLGLDVWAYRNLLTSLLGRAGLVPMATNDPEIAAHPANALLARIGPKAPPEAVTKFKSLLHQAPGKTR